jgi:hypothetical protein
MNTFASNDNWFSAGVRFKEARKMMEGCGYACMAGEPITSGLHMIVVEFGSSGDAYQSIGVMDSTMLSKALQGASTYMSSYQGNFGLITGKIYRNGKSERSAFDLRGKTVTITLDMDSRSMSFRSESLDDEEYTMNNLPSSVHPICGVDGNWVRIVSYKATPKGKGRKGNTTPKGGKNGKSSRRRSLGGLLPDGHPDKHIEKQADDFWG